MLKALLLAGALFQTEMPVVTPTDDLVITESTRIQPGVYRIPDAGEPGVIRVEGDDILLLMEGVTLLGSAEGAEPDTFAGTGVVVKGNRNVVWEGGVHGFKVAAMVDGGEGNWLVRVNLEGNYAARLASTPEAEDPSDWLWPHENDEGQWAANYGASLWVRNASGTRIVQCRGRNSQNGILLDRSTGTLVRDCEFSFLSGWGIALWRSSDNVVAHNHFDWCVRGYSDGVYARGQDSAGILVFEQSHRNRFLQNSATHGGDGFFLYAGHETTRKTGEGGCNDNVVEGNDFSHAVANGIEATFSTGNRFADNRLDECNYGIWAGYSRDSLFERNVIRGCTYAGVAIEHGSGNVVKGNLIEKCPKGVALWWDEDKDLLESAYGKKNRTDSADTRIEANLIRGCEAGVHLRDSARIASVGNAFEETGREVVAEGECPDLEVAPAEGRVEPDVREFADRPNTVRGRRFIIVREWGPYDFSAPIVHPARVDAGRQALFRVLGVTGPVKIESIEGDVEVTLQPRGDPYPLILVRPAGDSPTLLPFRVRLETGTTKLEAAGSLLAVTWKVRYWPWETDPREGDEAFRELLAGKPALEASLDDLDLRWGTGSPGEGVPADRFATSAETTVRLPAGEYEIVTVSDDGVRVSVDGERVVERWTHHAPTEDRVEIRLEEGEHRILVEHFEIDGWARLGFRILPLSGKR